MLMTNIKIIFMVLMLHISVSCEAPTASESARTLNTGEIIIEDFDTFDLLDWQIVNDGVMGGISTSNFRVFDNATSSFQGNLSLANNGGFASMRAYYNSSLEGISKIKISVKGDGKRYIFRVRTDEVYWAAYGISFETIKDEWIDYEFQLKDFIPTSRGYQLKNMPNLNELDIREIGFMISDKQEGTFQLSIDWIKAQ